jgi:hypothetical protein
VLERYDWRVIYPAMDAAHARIAARPAPRGRQGGATGQHVAPGQPTQAG